MANNYIAKIENTGIRPSVQRVAVYTYLCQHPIHPTVDTVYTALSPVYPTLSRTTIYNTLKLFAEKGLVQTIQIEDDKLRFDANTEPHLHFKCTKCGNVFDVFDEKILKNINTQCSQVVPEGFSVEKIQTNIWGICNKCSEK